MRKILLALLLLLLAAPADAGLVVAGLTVSTLGPTLPGGATTSIVVSIDPVTGDTWVSNGQTLFRNDGAGGWDPGQSILQSGGGPVANNQVTADLAFDATGRQYISDFGTGQIFRRTGNGPWLPFASLPPSVRRHRFGDDGNLYAITNAFPSGPGLQAIQRVAPDGTVSTLAPLVGLDGNFFESFDFDAHGDLIIPDYIGTGIDHLNVGTGVITTLFTYDRPVPILFESIAVTAAGNFYVGVNTGAETGNTSKLVRINGLTGEQELIGTGIGGSGSFGEIIPVDLLLASADTLLISGFGSLHGLGLTGDLDGKLTAIPGPGALGLLAVGLVVVGVGQLLRRRGAVRT